MAIYVFIPARYGSTRLPGKPLLNLGGKPLVQWVYEGCRKSKTTYRIIIATDDERIKLVSEGFGATVIMTHSQHRSGTDRIAEAAGKWGCSLDDVIVNVQGDEPTVDGEIIDILSQSLTKHPENYMTTLAFSTSSEKELEDPNVVKVVLDYQMRALYFSRAPIPYWRDETAGKKVFWKHLGFYAYRYSFLKSFVNLPMGILEKTEKLEQLRALEHGYSIRVVSSPKDTISIDTKDDAKQFLRNLTNMLAKEKGDSIFY